MPSKKRSLDQCAHARVLYERIYCAKGHTLGNDSINIRMLERGAPLQFSVCQGCKDFDYMGEPVLATDRGWLDKLPS